MAATTEETWTFDGVLLNTYAYNIATRTGRAATAAPRGSLQRFPARSGAAFRARPVEPRVETLDLWVGFRDVDDVGPGSAQAARASLNANVETLMALFANTWSAVTLSKVKRLPAGLVTRVAEVTVESEFRLRARGPMSMTGSVDLLFPYPWWRGDSPETIDRNNVGSGGDTFNHVCPSHVESRTGTVRFTGTGSGVTNPSLTNNETGGVIRYTGTIAAGDWVELNVWTGTARDQADGNPVAGFSWDGYDDSPFVFRPGTNGLSAVCDSGTFDLDVSYTPDYVT